MTALRWPSIADRPLRARLTLASVWAAEDKMGARLASDRPGLFVRLGSFICALAGHRWTALAVCGAGVVGLAYMAARFAL